MSACATTPPAGGVPAEVTRFVERRAECDHWTGEEPYDAPRRRQIERAISDLRCAQIEEDEARLKARHAADAAAIKALLSAE